jgi:hypothetical protein
MFFYCYFYFSDSKCFLSLPSSLPPSPLPMPSHPVGLLLAVRKIPIFFVLKQIVEYNADSMVQNLQVILLTQWKQWFWDYSESKLSIFCLI